MNTTQQRMTAIFNEWARRYAANPGEFSDILDADGKPVEDYGQSCTLYFEKIADEMTQAGLLPLPETGGIIPPGMVLEPPVIHKDGEPKKWVHVKRGDK
jgi:hypothetical protein